MRLHPLAAMGVMLGATLSAAVLSLGAADEVPPVGVLTGIDLPAEIDETRGVPDDQREAYWRVLDVARRQSADEQRKWAAESNADRNEKLGPDSAAVDPDDTSWFDVMRSPDRYRLRLVTFRGRLKRLDRVEQTPNDHGVDAVYEGRLVPYDSEQAPVFIACTTIPEGLPTGGELLEDVAVTGYFFKKESYESDGDILAAPLILAGTLEWFPRGAVDPTRLGPDLLAPVRQFSKGIPEMERDSYYRALAQAREVPVDELRRASAEWEAERRRTHEADPKRRKYKFVVEADLFKYPREVAGRPVTLRGHLRKLVTSPATENDYGITTLHEAWLYPEDGQGNPVVVICTSIPQDMPRPTGKDAVDNVWFTGYFFKMYVYDAEEKTRFAPLFLAQRLEWKPLDTGIMPASAKYAIGAAGVLLIVLYAAFQVRSFRRDRAFRQAELKGELITGAELQSLAESTLDISGTPRGSPTQSGAGETSVDEAKPV